MKLASLLKHFENSKEKNLRGKKIIAKFGNGDSNGHGCGRYLKDLLIKKIVLMITAKNEMSFFKEILQKN